MVKYGEYEVDEQGNLREGAEGAAASGTDGRADAPVTAAARRLFLWGLFAADLIGFLVFAGAAVLLPESRTILIAITVLYLAMTVPIFVWMSRSTKRKVERSSAGV